MPTGSTVLIEYDGTDITGSVLFSNASFEVQFSAIPGTFDITCTDPNQTLSFSTGKELTLTIDGQLFFGGYVTQVTRKFAIPVDRTDQAAGGAAGVKTRQWNLRGVDYNILFDKRVLRFSSATSGAGFLTQLPDFHANDQIDVLIKNELCAKYLDLPANFDSTTNVEAVDIVVPGSTSTEATSWMTQGTTWRKQMEDLTQFNGGIWYIGPGPALHLHPVESMEAKWGFSDAPNHRDDLVTAGDPQTFRGATYGFRELEVVEDGSYIVNDALVWGGSEWAGAGTTVFARAQNAESIASYKRWQRAEIHFGEDSYGIQDGVDVRATTIVSGSPSQGEEQLYGLKNTQWQFKLAWFAHEVPKIAGVRQHLTPGQVVTFHMFTFGSDLSHPLVRLLPLRNLRVSFVTLDPAGNAYVRFDGFFGIQPNDPWTLWRYLLSKQRQVFSREIAAVTNSSSSAAYGAQGTFLPEETPDGIITDFSIYITVDGVHASIGYIVNTTNVTRNGITMTPGVDYTELDPDGGVIRFLTPPVTGDTILIRCRTTSG